MIENPPDPVQVHYGRMNVSFPTHCACCGGRPNTTVDVTASMEDDEYVHNTSWSVPYCMYCAHHVGRSSLAALLAAGVAVAAVVAVLWFRGFDVPGWQIALTIVGGFPLWFVVTMGLMPMLCTTGPRCHAIACAVEVAGPYAGQYQWSFDDPRFARAFKEANGIGQF